MNVSAFKIKTKCDVLILGGGVIGLGIGIALLESRPNLTVIIVEKEEELALHASGRNSGVLHAGFYYSPDSLKARFCREGNAELRQLAKKYDVQIHDVGKVVVARNSEEVTRLKDLFNRGITNGVDLEIHHGEKLKNFEPLANTYEQFLWSPTTGVSDPKKIMNAMCREFYLLGGKIDFQRNISLVSSGSEVHDDSNSYQAKYIVNATGAYADRIARSLGVGLDYAMVPFLGIYRATSVKNLPLQRLVYPVPHPVNPFLGVHFTLTVDRKVKIGPTAIPITGREQYTLLSGWSLEDIQESLKGMSALIRGDFHDFGAMIKTEWPKLFQKMLIRESAKLVPTVFKVNDWQWKPPGIRAQLVQLSTGKLEQDFVIQRAENCVHVLNAVSPGWTSSLPFGRFISESIIGI